jgi:hypothetical protein
MKINNGKKYTLAKQNYMIKYFEMIELVFGMPAPQFGEESSLSVRIRAGSSIIPISNSVEPFDCTWGHTCMVIT